MTTAIDFMRAILSEPAADVPRLVYADWLEENGDAARAEFIRVQCELARPCRLGYSDAFHVDMPCAACDPLARRERELLDAHGHVWADPVACLLGGVPEHIGGGKFNVRARPQGGLAPQIEFHRGFVAAVTMDAASFLAVGPMLLAQNPIEEVALTTLPEVSWGAVAGSARSRLCRLVGRERQTHIQYLENPFAARQRILLECLRAEFPSVNNWHLPGGADA